MGAANGAKPGRNGAQSAVRTRFQQSVPASTPFVPRRGESYEIGPPVRQRALAERFRTVCYGSAPGSRLATPAVGATRKLDATRGQLKARRGHSELADRQRHALAAPRFPPPASCGSDLCAAICAPRAREGRAASRWPRAASSELRVARVGCRFELPAARFQLPASGAAICQPRGASRELAASGFHLPASALPGDASRLRVPTICNLCRAASCEPRAASHELRATRRETRAASHEPRAAARGGERDQGKSTTAATRAGSWEPEAGSRKLGAGSWKLETRNWELAADTQIEQSIWKKVCIMFA
jgi:hypothetical protein